MASFAYVVDYALLADLTQANAGRLISESGEYNIQALNAAYTGGTTVDGGEPHVIPTPRDSYAYVEATWATMGYDWFGKVHLTPRTKIEFGNIVTTLSVEYELFNAWKVDVTLTSITNNVGAGISLPDAPVPPEVLPSFASFLDPATTRLNPVKLRVVADADGPPTFDDTIDFLFDTGEDPFLDMSGNRISVILPEFEDNLQERWSFLTEVIPTVSGKEQRISLRRNPRQEFQLTYLLDGDERRRLQNTLFGWQSKLFAIPMWHEQMRSTAAVVAGDTVLQVNTTTNFDFRVGGLALIYQSSTQYDVMVLSAVNANSLEFDDSPLLNSYDSNAKVMPVRLGYITNSVRGARYKTTLERFELSITVADNDTGIFEESTTGWNTYNSKVLLDDNNVMESDQIPSEFQQNITFIDNDVGNIAATSRWESHKHVSQKGFFTHSRAEKLKLLKLLFAFRGKQKSFYLPSFIEDFTAASNLVIGEATIDIDHVEYTRFVNAASPRNVIRVTFTDGTDLTREIVGASEVSDTVEELTLDNTWPANRTVAEIERIELFELSRFDTDVFTFRFLTPHKAIVTAPTVTVFDDQ